ncbi:MAG: hypothetical protein AAFY88_30435 [Acidobacteriota bacterium]
MLLMTGLAASSGAAPLAEDFGELPAHRIHDGSSSLASGDIVDIPVLINGSGRFSSDETTEIRMNLFFGASAGDNTRALVTSTGIGDAGKIFRANRTTNPNFDSIAATLTNGLDDFYIQLHAIESGGGGTSRLESSVFGDIPGGNGIDLEGFDVTDIIFKVTSFTLESPGSDPNGDGIWTEYLLIGTVTIQSGDIFADGFESGDLSAWSGVIQP